MPNQLSQNSFAGGELTPSAYGRVDLARYQTALKTCRNFVVRVTGGVINRAGTKMICELKDSTKAGRLIPFQFSTTQGYALQFEDGAMRVVKDGGQVLHVNTIIAVQNTTPIVVQFAAQHRYLTGQQMTIAGTGIAALDGNTFVVTNFPPGSYVQLNGTTAAGTSATGSASGIYEIVAPYSEAQLAAVKYTQLADVMTLCNQAVRPKDLSRSGHDNWSFVDMAFREGPFQDINATNTKGVAVVGASFAVGATVTINASHAIFSASNVGQLFYVEQKNFGQPWEVGKSVTAGDLRRSEGRYYRALNTATTGTLRPTNESPGDVESDGAVNWEYAHSGYGIVQIASFVDANTVTATVLLELPAETGGTEKTITGAANNGSGLVRITAVGHGYSSNDAVVIYDVTGTTEANGMWVITVIDADHFDLKASQFGNAYVSGGKAVKNGTYKYAFGAWGGDQGWPGVVTYFQQRKVLAATTQKPQHIWASGTNAFDFFGKSTPLKDDDAITMQLAGNEVNAIRHMFDFGKLIVFTAGNKWVIPDDDNNPVITPSQKSARPQGSIGASDVRPSKVEDAILYVLDKGQQIQDIAYQYASNAYSGNDLSVLWQHLLEGHQVVAAAYQHTPFRTLWAVRDDGVLVGVTYLREHQVWGGHRHDTDGLFEDVCVVSEPPEDAVYFLVKRTINGQTKRYVERMASRLYTDIRDAFFVDCGLSYDGRNTTAITMTVFGGIFWTYTEGFQLIASAAYFSASHVGDEIHLTDNDGRILRLEIVGYTNATSVNVRANRDVPSELQLGAGTTSWTHAKKAFSGLTHLEGKTVSILADGHVHPQRVVASGAVSLQFAAGVVHVGLPMTADFETLDMNVQGQEIRAKQKIVNEVELVVEESRGIFAGEDFDNLLEYKQREDENYDDPVSLLTGQAAISIKSTWSRGGRVCVRQQDPLPLSILAAIPSVSVGS